MGQAQINSSAALACPQTVAYCCIFQLVGSIAVVKCEVQKQEYKVHVMDMYMLRGLFRLQEKLEL